MATRVIKSGGSSVEFGLAPQPLHVEDLDSDLDAIFGDITDANIALNAGIATAKLASDAGIVSGMLANGAVTNAKIAAGAVTVDKLALGAFGVSATGVGIPGTYTTETIALSITVTPTEAGLLLVGGAMGWTIVMGSTQFNPIIRLRWKLDGVLFYIVDFPTDDTQTTPNVPLNLPLPTPSAVTTVAAGSHTVTLTAEVSGINCSVVVNATNPGGGYALVIR